MSYQKKEEIQPTSLNVMFIDIETVPQFTDWKSMPDRMKFVFSKKFERQLDEMRDRFMKEDEFENSEEFRDFYRSKCSIQAEFGKIVCISMGIVELKDAKYKLRVKSIAGRNEKKILEEITPLLVKSVFLCAHAGKTFDFGYMSRRFLANGLRIPAILNTIGKKPWEVNLIDTMELWGFTSFNYTASLDALAMVFGLPSPKASVDGSQVFDLFYHTGKTDELPWEGEEERMKAIVTYCEGDVITLANVWLSLMSEKTIAETDVVRV
jgi:hypothetical protein